MDDALDAVVLDTNAVLDWLVFRDPRIATLAAAIESGRLRWVACERMRDEFAHVLKSRALHRWHPDHDALLHCYERRASMQSAPPPAPPRLRCDDSEDQVFVDLALACGARWLFSHDKALLRLRRRMPPDGPRICRPFDWAGP